MQATGLEWGHSTGPALYERGLLQKRGQIHRQPRRGVTNVTLLLYVSPLIFGVLLGLALVISIARVRYVPGSRSLSVMIAGGALWCGGYALEFLSPNLGGKIFWAKFQYFGIVTIPLAWLYFSHRYLESHDWPRLLISRLLLPVIPALTLVFVWTNEAHRLIWQDWHVQDVGG